MTRMTRMARTVARMAHWLTDLADPISTFTKKIYFNERVEFNRESTIAEKNIQRTTFYFLQVNF